MQTQLVNSDCIKHLKTLDDNIFDSCVTDPPYHLTSIVKRFTTSTEPKGPLYKRLSTGFMGQTWDGGDIAFTTEMWKEVYRTLKPGGYLLSFSASRNYHRMAVAIEDSGFEIRDQIMWIYGSGFPKSYNIGKGVDKKLGNEREVVGKGKAGAAFHYGAVGDGGFGNTFDGNGTASSEWETTQGKSEWEGWGTALKPAHEPIVMARKSIEGSIVDNVLKHGTGGINIDECRISYGDGRFPANVMHDGSEEVVSGFPNTGQGDGNPYSYAGKEYNNKDTSMFNGDKPQAPSNYNDIGSAARYFYCPKTSKSERNQGLFEFEDKQYSHDGRKKSIENPYQRNKSISKNSHPTVKPVELMKYLCRLVTPKGGTVLDPFMGSGSTGMAAKDEGFDFIGIEREKEYFEISEQRIKTTAPLSEFFA